MRLIDADAFREQLDHAYEYTELGEVIEMLDNAPTVERPHGERTERALTIIDRLRTDEHINNKECGTLRRAILLPERPTEVNCSHCDYFKFSKQFIENVVKFMADYKIETVEDLMKELNHINEWLGGRE